MCTGDHVSHERFDARAHPRHAIAAVLSVEGDLAQAAVLCLLLERRDEEPLEREPGIVDLERLLRGQLDRGDPLLEERVDQLFLVLEAPVDGADAHPRVARDVIERHVQPSLGEDLARRREDALAVPRGILAKRALRGLCEQLGSGHERSLAPKW